ncbi:GH3 auxin-responsive promoter family protein [Candidatus Brachybacter algidus]|uniref:GH3 family domain-containing protein n=1 Tax=Candidatus Brachybacter algidus TaxID=2982024 RepID=UPI00257AD963|nr:GH3 auxin-responsive promoter family protein [Candidatus Brachybacter algidus]
MINFARIVNKLWLSSQRNDHKYFIQNISNASHIQQELLMKYIGQNTNSAFGIDHDFRWIDSYEQFCEKVPIIEDYSMLDSYIDRIKLGENNILTKEKVLFMETTSGTSAASKFIPYTSSLRSEFQKALAVWMTESHRLNPEAFSGKAYWSISPPLKSNGITSGGLRIGIESDTEYLNPWMAKLMSMVLSVPAQNIRASSSEEFYMELCSRLLADESLSFISVWSPNYFLQLHNFILKNREVLFNNNYLSEKEKHTFLP